MAYKKEERLTAAEKERLREAVGELLSLDWTVAKLARYLGYSSGIQLYRVLAEGGGMSRDRFQKIMSLVEECTLASEVDLPDPPGRRAAAEKRRTRAEHARELWSQLKARGVSYEQVTRALGYERPGAFTAALRSRSLPEDRYRSLTAFADMVLLGTNGNGNGSDDRDREVGHLPAVNERPKDVARPAGNGRPEANGRPAATGTGAKSRRNGTCRPPHVRTGIPVYDFLRTARDELDNAASTLERAHDEVANALTGPGIQRFRSEILKIQRQIDEVLAMQ